MVAQRSLVLLAAIFAAARSQAPVGGPHGRPHVARYLRGEGREDEEAPALHSMIPLLFARYGSYGLAHRSFGVLFFTELCACHRSTRH